MFQPYLTIIQQMLSWMGNRLILVCGILQVLMNTIRSVHWVILELMCLLFVFHLHLHPVMTTLNLRSVESFSFVFVFIYILTVPSIVVCWGQSFQPKDTYYISRNKTWFTGQPTDNCKFERERLETNIQRNGTDDFLYFLDTQTRHLRSFYRATNSQRKLVPLNFWNALQRIKKDFQLSLKKPLKLFSLTRWKK